MIARLPPGKKRGLAAVEWVRRPTSWISGSGHPTVASVPTGATKLHRLPFVVTLK